MNPARRPSNGPNGREIRYQDILHVPLGKTVDLVVSAMAMHHVEDTNALLRTLQDHLAPGGRRLSRQRSLPRTG